MPGKRYVMLQHFPLVPYFDGKNTRHSLSKCITTSEVWWFQYWLRYWPKVGPIRVSVSVSDLNQNSGFGRSLAQTLLRQCSDIAETMLRNYWDKTSIKHTYTETII